MNGYPEDLTLVLEMNGEAGVLKAVADYPPEALILLDEDVLTVRDIREAYARHRRQRRRRRKRGR